jgi:hypothetical protein
MISANEAASAAWNRLSFVQVDPAGEDAVRPNLWAVSASGDWAADCETGRGFADETVRYMRGTGDLPMLGRIVAGMTGERTGIEAGFFAGIAEAVL